MRGRKGRLIKSMVQHGVLKVACDEHMARWLACHRDINQIAIYFPQSGSYCNKKNSKEQISKQTRNKNLDLKLLNNLEEKKPAFVLYNQELGVNTNETCCSLFGGASTEAENMQQGGHKIQFLTSLFIFRTLAQKGPCYLDTQYEIEDASRV